VVRPGAAAAAALAAIAGCSNVLGLSPPHQAVDAGADAPPDAAAGHVRVVVDGTAIGGGSVTSTPPGIACPGACEATFPPGTQVTLTATAPGADVRFTGFHVGCTSADPTCTWTPAGDVQVYARYWRRGNVAFVSSTRQHPGAFDGVGAADTLCGRLASDAGVPGRFVALLPTTTTPIRAHIIEGIDGTAPGLWMRPDGQVVAFTIDDLAAGHLVAPIRLDELGRDVGDDRSVVVTDTTITGDPGAGTHCSGWASQTAGRALAGEPAGGTGRWVAATTIGCNEDARVYCVANDDVQPIASIAAAGPLLFVSNGTIAANAGVQAMDALCLTEASAATLPHSAAMALVTPGGGKPVKDRFTNLIIDGVVQRTDGARLAPSLAALLATSAFPVVPNLNAVRTYLDVDVWTGGPSFDQVGQDCDGWASAAAAQFGTTRPAATTRDATLIQQSGCDALHHVWCLSANIASP
jgi:hypothetical protein